MIGTSTTDGQMHDVLAVERCGIVRSSVVAPKQWIEKGG